MKKFLLRYILTQNSKQLGINIFILSTAGILLSTASFFINNYISNNYFTFTTHMQYRDRFVQKHDLVNITFEQYGSVPTELIRQAYNYFLVLKACNNGCDNEQEVLRSTLLEINSFEDYSAKTTDNDTVIQKSNKDIKNRGQNIKTAELYQNLITWINFVFQAIVVIYSLVTVIKDNPPPHPHKLG